MDNINSSQTITEKTYPISPIWIFKVNFVYLVFLLIIVKICLSLALDFFVIFIIVISSLIIMLLINGLARINFHFLFNDKFISVRQGIIFKRQRNLVYGVIQNILIKQSFFDRIFGIASLSLEDASKSGNQFGNFGDLVGSWGHKINIPGLKKQKAEDLKSIILNKLNEQVGHDGQSGL